MFLGLDEEGRSRSVGNEFPTPPFPFSSYVFHNEEGAFLSSSTRAVFGLPMCSSSTFSFSFPTSSSRCLIALFSLSPLIGLWEKEVKEKVLSFGLRSVYSAWL